MFRCSTISLFRYFCDYGRKLASRADSSTDFENSIQITTNQYMNGLKLILNCLFLCELLQDTSGPKHAYMFCPFRERTKPQRLTGAPKSVN